MEQYIYGSIVLIPPATYFSWEHPEQQLALDGLTLGQNALVFYETREAWNNHNPAALGWHVATQRLAPLGGQYVARIPATTAAKNGGKIVEGYNTTALKGAGIRVYEYADHDTIAACRLQLEAVFWHCYDSIPVVVAAGLTDAEARARKEHAIKVSAAAGLLDYARLTQARVLNRRRETTCPLCLERLSAQGFFDRMDQADGREVPDLTVTKVNLFHIQELRVGTLHHRAYNLGWGHHHCNVVVKDSGIVATLTWMVQVIDRNVAEGLLTPPQPQTTAV